MKIIKQIFFFFICAYQLVIITNIFSQTLDNKKLFMKTISCNRAVKIGLNRRIDLRITLKKIENAQAEYKIALAEFFPKMEVYSISSYNKYFSDPVDFDQYQSNAVLRLTQNLYSGGKVLNQLKMSKTELLNQELLDKIYKKDIAFSIIKACWEYKKWELLEKSNQEIVNQAEIIRNIAEVKYHKGVISRLEKDEAVVYYKNAYINYISAKQMTIKSKHYLLKTMGITDKVDESFSISDKLSHEISPVEDINVLIGRALNNRLELLLSKNNIRYGKFKLQSQRSVLYPKLYLIGEVKFKGNNTENFYDTWNSFKKDSFSIMLEAHYNIFDGFSTRNSIAKSENQLIIEKLEYEKINKAIINDVKQAYNSLVHIIKMIVVANKNTKIARHNLLSIMKKFNLGRVSVNEIEEYKTTMIESQNLEIINNIDYEIAVYSLKWATGDLLH